MADFNFLDSKLTTDTVNKKVTLNFTSLRGTFSVTSSSVSTIGAANGIYLKINSAGGTASSFTVDLKTLGLPTGSYTFVECEITGTSKSPAPKHIVKENITV
jgi:carbon monoxide dehydrogenase subunit G